MGHSRAEKAESRERILAEAARRIREAGLESIVISDLMKSAGLTHGAFYAHFPSRSALLAAALDRALVDGVGAYKASKTTNRPPSLKAIINSYLSPVHRDAVGEGCAISALGGEVARADDDVRTIMRDRLAGFIDETIDAIGDGPDAKYNALSAWSTMVGAIVLARLFKDESMADDILRAARSSILNLTAKPRA